MQAMSDTMTAGSGRPRRAGADAILGIFAFFMFSQRVLSGAPLSLG